MKNSHLKNFSIIYVKLHRIDTFLQKDVHKKILLIHKTRKNMVSLHEFLFFPFIRNCSFYNLVLPLLALATRNLRIKCKVQLLSQVPDITIAPIFPYGFWLLYLHLIGPDVFKTWKPLEIILEVGRIHVKNKINISLMFPGKWKVRPLCSDGTVRSVWKGTSSSSFFLNL